MFLFVVVVIVAVVVVVVVVVGLFGYFRKEPTSSTPRSTLHET